MEIIQVDMGGDDREFPLGISVLLYGGVGTGKTTFCLNLVKEFLANNYPCIWFCLDTSPNRIREQLKYFEVDYQSHEQKKNLIFIDAYSSQVSVEPVDDPAVIYCSSASNLNELSMALKKAMDQISGKGLVLLDSVSNMLLYTNQSLCEEFLKINMNRISMNGWTGFYILQKDLHEKRTEETLKMMADGVLDFDMEEGSRVVRVMKLPFGSSGDWIGSNLFVDRTGIQKKVKREIAEPTKYLDSGGYIEGPRGDKTIPQQSVEPETQADMGVQFPTVEAPAQKKAPQQGVSQVPRDAVQEEKHESESERGSVETPGESKPAEPQQTEKPMSTPLEESPSTSSEKPDNAPATRVAGSQSSSVSETGLEQELSEVLESERKTQIPGSSGISTPPITSSTEAVSESDERQPPTSSTPLVSTPSTSQPQTVQEDSKTPTSSMGTQASGQSQTGTPLTQPTGSQPTPQQPIPQQSTPQQPAQTTESTKPSGGESIPDEGPHEKIQKELSGSEIQRPDVNMVDTNALQRELKDLEATIQQMAGNMTQQVGKQFIIAGGMGLPDDLREMLGETPGTNEVVGDLRTNKIREEETRRELNEIARQKETASRELRELQSRIAALEKSIEEKHKRFELLEKQKAKAKNDFQKSQDNLRTLKVKMKSLLDRKRMMDETVKKITNMDQASIDIEPYLNALMLKKEKESEKLKNDLDTFDSREFELSSSIEKLEDEYRQVRQTMDGKTSDLDYINQRETIVTTEIGAIVKERKANEERLSQIVSKKKELLDKIKRLKDVNEGEK